MRRVISISLLALLFLMAIPLHISASNDYTDNGVLWDINGTTLRCLIYAEDVSEIVIPEGITKISRGAFNPDASPGLDNTKSIYIPDSVRVIGDAAFINCTSLCEVRLPEGLKIITPNMFYNCTSLKQIEIPESVELIADGAFAGCSSLEEINFPANLLRIGQGAFKSCDKLQDVVIPKSVKEIGTGTFDGCALLENIQVSKDTCVRTNAFSGTSFAQNQKTDYIVSGSTLIQYNGHEIDIIIPDGITRIDDKAFMGSVIENIQG